jgi:hypothetical protein
MFKYIRNFGTLILCLNSLDDTANQNGSSAVTSQVGEKAIRFMKQQVQQKYPDRHPTHLLYQAIVDNIALGGSESWALREEYRSKQETFHYGRRKAGRMCKWTVWDTAEKRITNEKVGSSASNSPTMELMMGKC